MTKYREPVLGVHDLISPQGRVTLETFNPDTGKVRQRVRNDNLVTNAHYAEMKQLLRGPQGFDWWAKSGTADTAITNENDGSQTPDSLAAYWHAIQDGALDVAPYSAWAIQQRCILLSDSVEAANADEFMFPGFLTGIVDLVNTVSPGTNLKLAGLSASGCYRDRSVIHMEAEWGTAYANGDHNSVGVGNGCWSTASQFAWPQACMAAGQGGQQYESPSAGGYLCDGTLLGYYTALLSMERVSDSEIWAINPKTTGYHIYRYDFTTLASPTNNPFFQTPTTAAQGLGVQGPTLSSMGIPAAQCGITAVGTSLFFGFGTTLLETDKPTTTTPNILNTFAPTGVTKCRDLTTDGTYIYWLDDTKVWKLTTAGAVVTSWLHNLNTQAYTGVTGSDYAMKNINWTDQGVAAPQLTISRNAYEAATTGWMYPGSSSVNETPNINSVFDMSGTPMGEWAMQPLRYSTTMYPNSGLVMPLNNDRSIWLGDIADYYGGTQEQFNVIMPCHASRTVLPTTVTKTSSDAMRVVYEFGF